MQTHTTNAQTTSDARTGSPVPERHGRPSSAGRSAWLSCLTAALLAPTLLAADELPFDSTIETYREKDTDVVVFAVRLEQPFLAEEFEKSNYLRLKPLGENAYLVYPRETKFQQKHAEFYGRLRGEGSAKLQLSYEVVSENLDGSRRVDVRQAEVEIPIPDEPTGSKRIYQAWARQQNEHFAKLLQYYPETTFFEYVLLQSRERYGVDPPDEFRRPSRSPEQTETDLYHVFSGGLAVQQSLQRQAYSGTLETGDLNIHISQLSPPRMESPDYEGLLEKKREQGAVAERLEIAKLIPADQYLFHCNSVETANELAQLSVQWGESLLRLFTVTARDPHLKQKYEDQLCIKQDALTQLFANAVISEFAITGSDFFFAEGTDVGVIMKVEDPETFRQASASWLEDVKQRYSEVQEREFNYRGHKVAARYRRDRMVSSFVVMVDQYAIFSNSHVSIRKLVDTVIGDTSNLYDELDYEYISMVLPAQPGPDSAYLYASDAFLRRLVSPKFKIAEKRRLQAFNHLVMLNNASMFYRLEYNESPQTLSDLVEGDFVDPSKIVDPTGGAFAFDPVHDTCTSSLYNRIKYLTPIVELDVLKISQQEKDQYERYKQRYQAFWSGVFDPIAVRMTLGDAVKLETAVLPFANSSLYADLQRMLADNPQPLNTANTARSAFASVHLVPAKGRTGNLIRAVPGVPEALQADPTLTDLSWLGDQVTLHFCDANSIIEIDPTRLRTLDLLGRTPVSTQLAISSALAAMNLPVYFTVDVSDTGKAERLLQHLTSRIFLENRSVMSLPSQLDAYRLPDYKGHATYVLSYQLYAVKVRLHLGLVNHQLVAATEPHVLREVIDAAENQADRPVLNGHALLRLNFRAIDKLENDLQLYWSEKLRQACHRNIMPIYNLIKLYDVSVDNVNELADAKYGVTYFCPGGGEYVYDAESDQVSSTVYGNRQNARQNLELNEQTAFAEFLQSLDEIQASLKFTDDGLIGTVEIYRTEQP